MVSRPHIRVLLTTGLLALAVAGCGGSNKAAPTVANSVSTATSGEAGDKGVSNSAVPAPGGAVHGHGVVARVGSYVISRTAFEARMASVARAQNPGHPLVPDPPTYRRCVAQLASSSSSAAKSRLQARCAHLYREEKAEVLKELISAAWVIVGAREHGIAISDEEVRQALRSGWPSAAKLDAFLEATGESVSDVLYTVKIQKLTAKLRSRGEAIPPLSTTTVAGYYASHLSDYVVPEERDIGIVRGRSLKTAMLAKAELEHGASFERAAATIGHQPLYLAAGRGLMKGLKRHVLKEPVLDSAIFKARPHVVSGPVRINRFPGYHYRFHQNPNDINNIDGYYVFAVEAVRPAKTTPLEQVKAQLERELPTLLKKQALARSIRSWRARLRLETDCLPGFVVRKCRQYHPISGEEPEDPYTIG
jgi:PPIC-type PPIASE domain